MITKQEANYRDRPKEAGLRRCAFCSMYKVGGGCTLVKGKIKSLGVCDRWDSAFFPSEAPK